MTSPKKDSRQNESPEHSNPTSNKKSFNFYLSRILELHKTNRSKRADTPETTKSEIQPKKNKF